MAHEVLHSVARRIPHSGRWALALLVLLALISASLLATAPKPEAKLNELPEMAVEAYAVQQRDITPEAIYTGRLLPMRSAELRFDLTGQLRVRSVEPGMQVRKGDEMLVLDDRDFMDQDRTARAELELEQRYVERDRVRLKQVTRQRDLQRKESERLRELNQKALVSQSALNAAEQMLAGIESEKASLEAMVHGADQRLELKQVAADRARRDLERTRLVAPFDGQVNTVDVEVGDRITGDQPVMTVIDSSALDFYVEVDGETAAALELGQMLDVEVDQRQVPGTLVALRADPDPRTYTFALRVRIPGDAALSGQLARVRLPLSSLRGVLVVPVAAVRVEISGQSVFRIEGDRLQRVDVSLGPRVGELQVIEGSVRAGELIVARDVAAVDVRRRVVIRDGS